MLVEKLKELGLSENEAAIYLSLLELGSTTTGPLIKKSGLYRVMVYDTLEKLTDKGLVYFTIRKNRKEFTAQDPKQILLLIKQKEQLARETIKELSSLQVINPTKKGTIIYEGWKGIKAAMENFYAEMKRGKGEYCAVGASRQLHKKIDAYFNDFHERRSKLKVPARILFNYNNKTFAKTKAKFKPVQIRFMPKKVVTPSRISMYDDMVLIDIADDKPMAFFIKNEQVAKSYRQYFEFMWAQGKP